MNIDLNLLRKTHVDIGTSNRSVWVLRNSPEARQHAAQAVASVPRQQKTFKAFIPARVVSEANKSEHGIKKWKRTKEQKAQVFRAFPGLMGRGKPKQVLLVLLTENLLDADDNLPGAVKYHKDAVATLCGFNDRERVWKYDQRKPHSYEMRGVWIHISF